MTILPTTSKNLAFVFPGQGSQAVGMLEELSECYGEVTETFAEASAVLGMDLWSLVSNGPEETLNLTQNTQPAMLAAGVAVWRIWRRNGGPMPAFMAGHSLGEYSALVCADSIGFSDAVRLVADRARFMQEAVAPGDGAMAAVIGLDDDSVRKLCADNAEGEVLEPVNYNAPGQVVIAGAAAAVARATEQARAAGAKRAIVLPVSVPSHCSLMRVAAERLTARLAEIAIKAPRIPVLHNIHVSAERDPDAIRRALAQQLYSPVRWVETISHICAQGVSLLIECGPGKVLSGLNKRIDRHSSTLPVFDRATLEQALEAAAA